MNSDVQSTVWFDGTDVSTGVQTVVVKSEKLELEIDGWTENDQYSTVIINGWDDIPDDVKEMFEYVIYEDGKPDVPVSPENIQSGLTYVCTSSALCLSTRVKS